jgi:hypothetical protein
MEGYILCFLKSEWKVSDTGSDQCWASSFYEDEVASSWNLVHMYIMTWTNICIKFGAFVEYVPSGTSVSQRHISLFFKEINIFGIYFAEIIQEIL